eukprot:jgi/Galph1/1217/GphlegSOOS_G6086.1
MKSEKDFSTLSFDGDFLKVSDLKLMVVEKRKLNYGEGFDLVITDAQSNEGSYVKKKEVQGGLSWILEYTEESALIPKNSSVVIKRVPGQRPGGILSQQVLARKNERYAEKDVSRSSMRASNVTEKVNKPVGELKEQSKGAEDEEERITSVVDSSNITYSQKPRFVQHNPLLDRPPPPNYRCHRCGKPGHWIHHCPTNGDPNFDIVRVRRPTGIPRSMLQSVEAPVRGTGLRTPGGEFVTLKPNEDEFSRRTAALRRMVQQRQTGGSDSEATSSFDDPSVVRVADNTAENLSGKSSNEMEKRPISSEEENVHFEENKPSYIGQDLLTESESVQLNSNEVYPREPDRVIEQASQVSNTPRKDSSIATSHELDWTEELLGIPKDSSSGKQDEETKHAQEATSFDNGKAMKNTNLIEYTGNDEIKKDIDSKDELSVAFNRSEGVSRNSEEPSTEHFTGVNLESGNHFQGKTGVNMYPQSQTMPPYPIPNAMFYPYANPSFFPGAAASMQYPTQSPWFPPPFFPFPAAFANSFPPINAGQATGRRTRDLYSSYPSKQPSASSGHSFDETEQPGKKQKRDQVDSVDDMSSSRSKDKAPSHSSSENRKHHRFSHHRSKKEVSKSSSSSDLHRHHDRDRDRKR